MQVGERLILIIDHCNDYHKDDHYGDNHVTNYLLWKWERGWTTAKYRSRVIETVRWALAVTVVWNISNKSKLVQDIGVYFWAWPCEKYLSQGKTDGDDVRPIMLSKSAAQLNWRYVSQDVKHFLHSTSMRGGHQRRKTFKPELIFFSLKPEVMRRWPQRQVGEENQWKQEPPW